MQGRDHPETGGAGCVAKLQDWQGRCAPDQAGVLQMALDLVAALPEPFRQPALLVHVRVEDFPSETLMEEMEVKDPFELTGLYDGIPVTEKSVMDQPGGPDIVWLYRRPLLDEWVARGDVALGDLVGHVVTHELAHHFGWSDADIASIDRWWE